MGGYYNPTGTAMPAQGGFFNNNQPTTGTTNFGSVNTGGTAGSNQYFNGIPGMSTPGNTSISGYSNDNALQTGYKGASSNLGGGLSVIRPQYPGLGLDFANMLNSQIGQGLPQFDMSTLLPTGGSTAPGQLTAGMNPLLAQLNQFFQTGQGGNMPGMNTLSTIANQGVSALPEWQAMIAAQQQNIGMNQADLAAQFAGTGNIAGSGFGTAMSQFQQGTTANQNSLLGQLQQSNIQNIQMPAINELFQGSQATAGALQTLDQNAIDNLYKQFQTDLPQNNPLLQYMSQYGSLYPPTATSETGTQQFQDIMGGINQGTQAAMNIAAMCPAEGSLILMMDGSEIPVEDLKPGDTIQGIDGEACVVDVVPTRYEDVIDVFTEDDSKCRNSHSHTFMLPKGGFVIASKALGRVILTAKGESRITAIEPAGKKYVFDILTDGSHTYCADGVWAQGGEVVCGMVVDEKDVVEYR